MGIHSEHLLQQLLIQDHKKSLDETGELAKMDEAVKTNFFDKHS